MNTSSPKIVTVVGARPQFVKAAVLRRRCDEENVTEILVHTGQHYDINMSDVFFNELDIRPAEYKMQLKNRSHAAMTGEIMVGIEEVLTHEKPDWCVVYGDTNSTLAAALAAAKLHVPVCHVEAGLRSFNKQMPEEINRVLTDHVSDLLFCPTHRSVCNLELENIKEGVFHVGDIMYDAAKLFSGRMSRDALSALYGLKSDVPIATVTLHRAETLSEEASCNAIVDYVSRFKEEFQLVFPMHPNTRKVLGEMKVDLGVFVTLPPLSYLAMQSLVAQSELVITDSGGLQKEAYFHGVRCITMRDETEWMETIENGWNRLWRQTEYARPHTH